MCGTATTNYFVDELSGRAVSCDVLPNEGENNPQSKCKGTTRFISVANVVRDGETVVVRFDGVNYSVPKDSVVPSGCKTLGQNGNGCVECENGYILYGGVCRQSCQSNEFFLDGECKLCNADDAFGQYCSKCSASGCETCTGGKVAVSGICQDCSVFTPHCSECGGVQSCTACSDDLVAVGNSCVTKSTKCQNAFGDGCLDCSNECTDCVADTCCPPNQHIVNKGNNDFSCGTCASVFDENCVSCTSAECLVCKDGMAVDSGVCTSCSDLFVGCGLCDSNECKGCANTSFKLTPNGCIFEELVDSGSNPESNNGKGKLILIVGIVVGVVVVAIIAVIVIYCVVSKARESRVNSRLTDYDDVEFDSV